MQGLTLPEFDSNTPPEKGQPFTLTREMWEKLTADWYDKGYTDGSSDADNREYEYGYSDGYEEGYQAGEEDASKA